MSVMKLYVGNLSYDVQEDELKELFASKGTVEAVRIISDHQSGRSKGFGFVEMATKEEGEAAISAFNGHDLKGRPLRVNESIDKPRGRGDGRNNRRW